MSSRAKWTIEETALIQFDFSKLSYDAIKIPGRTDRACQHQLNKIRSDTKAMLEATINKEKPAEQAKPVTSKPKRKRGSDASKITDANGEDGKAKTDKAEADDVGEAKVTRKRAKRVKA